MDYEEKYKQALERANFYHFGGVKQCIAETLEYIFPELKESEDEMIRKRLIEFFKDWGKTRSHCWSISISDILAWLEKQGEKPQGKTALDAIKELDDNRIRKELIDAIQGLWANDALPMPFTVKRKDEWLTWLEKQGGQETVIDKLNEIIGKLGDIHEELSKPFLFPYKDYTPPQEPWYKTHGVERVTPINCETLTSIEINNEKDNDIK